MGLGIVALTMRRPWGTGGGGATYTEDAICGEVRLGSCGAATARGGQLDCGIVGRGEGEDSAVVTWVRGLVLGNNAATQRAVGKQRLYWELHESRRAVDSEE